MARTRSQRSLAQIDGTCTATTTMEHTVAPTANMAAAATPATADRGCKSRTGPSVCLLAT